MRRNPRIALIGIPIAVLLFVVLGAAFAVRWRGAELRLDELRALADAAQPALPEDLPEPDGARPEATAWLVELASARVRWSPQDLASPDSYSALRARAQSGDLASEAEQLFGALEACAGASAPAAVEQVVRVLAARDGVAGIPPCGLEAVRLLALGSRAHVEVARRAGSFGGLSPRAVVGSLERTGGVFPSLPAPQALVLCDALAIEVARAAWLERGELVPELLRALRDVTRIFESAPLLVSAWITIELDLRLLAVLEFALPLLSAEVDLTALEADLAAIRPRARLAAAAAGERAFGNRAFEHLRRVGSWSDVRSGSLLPTSLTVSHDQAAFLRAWRERIERLELPAHRRPGPADRGGLAALLAPITASLAGSQEGILAAADELEARLVLAGAALAARRGGASELLAFAERSTDPYDGRPIRAGFGADGLVILWSIGPDRIDHGGLDDERDLVWRFKQR